MPSDETGQTAGEAEPSPRHEETVGETGGETSGEEVTAEQVATLLRALGTPGAGLRMGLPPFPFDVEVPPDWAVLRTPPGERDEDIEKVCQQTRGWRNLPAPRQVSLRQYLQGSAEHAYGSGVLLVAVGTGLHPDGQRPTFGQLGLSWLRTRPFYADLSLAQLAIGEEIEAEEFETSFGQGLFFSEVNDTGEDGEQRNGARLSYDTQAFVPVPDSEWMGVVTGTGTHETWAEPLRLGVVRMAQSLRRHEG